MPWPGLDDEIPIEDRKARRERSLKRWADEDEAGAVGKLPEDKRVMRQSKYATVQQVKGQHRNEKPEAEWTTTDLVAEFYWLTEQHAPGVPSQVNGEALAKWINRQVGQGVAREAILRGLRRFFADPRVIRDPGVGTPLWRRFLGFYPTVHGIVSKDPNAVDQATIDISARSVDKFLREIEEA